MDQFGFEQLAAWLAYRVSLPIGPLFCVIDGPTRGRRGRHPPHVRSCDSSPLTPGSGAGSRPIGCVTRTRSSSRGRTLAVNIIQRQLGRADLGTTSTYLQGIDPSEIIDAVRSRRQPTVSATAGLTL
jgi:hypothetical protein